MIKDRLLVIGLGNILMGDDGVGVHVIHELKRFNMAGNVDIVDGGTAGIDLLDILSLYQRVFVTDAMVTKGEGEARIRVFTIDDLLLRQDEIGYSMHDVDLTSTINLMKALEMDIPAITIIGIPAVDIVPKLGLSEECKRYSEVASQLLINMVKYFYLNPEKFDRKLQEITPDNMMEELHDIL